MHLVKGCPIIETKVSCGGGDAPHDGIQLSKGAPISNQVCDQQSSSNSVNAYGPAKREPNAFDWVITAGL